MSPTHNLNAVRFVCDGPGCYEERLIPLAGDCIPVGWTRVLTDNGIRTAPVFHSDECLTTWVRELSTVRQDDGAEYWQTVGSILEPATPTPVPTPPEPDPRVPEASAASQTYALDDLPF